MFKIIYSEHNSELVVMPVKRIVFWYTIMEFNLIVIILSTNEEKYKLKSNSMFAKCLVLIE